VSEEQVRTGGAPNDQPSADAPIAAGPQPTPAVTPETPPSAGRVVDPETRDLLAAVLDRLVPPHDDLPGAGSLDTSGARNGIVSFLERTLAGDAALRRLFLDGLRAIEIAAGSPFTSLDADQRDTVLRQVEIAEPAFFAALVNHTYRGYYTHPRVLRHLEATHGYANRPPQPLGHAVPPWDEALLARQRDRVPFWRKTS
jgi:hypothetical protein